MAGYNRIVMVGNLTRDPEYKQLTSGQAVCRLGLAANRQFKNRQSGAMVQEVCYVDIDVWGAQAESCRQYLQKGRSVLVEGRLKLDSWKDQEGQARSKHSIVADRVLFLSANNGDAPVTGATVDRSAGQAKQQDRFDPNNVLEQDILDQLDSIKNKQATKEVSKKQAPIQKSTEDTADDLGDSVIFNDEPPFQDDLPF